MTGFIEWLDNRQDIPTATLGLVRVTPEQAKKAAFDGVDPMKICSIMYHPSRNEWSMLWFAAIPRIGPTDWRIDWCPTREKALAAGRDKGCTHFKEGPGKNVPVVQEMP